LVTAKSIADGLDAMIAFCQAIITGIDLSRKMTESRWNTYKFPDELKNAGWLAKLRINIWWLFFPWVDMMSAHDKGVRSVMKDVLEYFCYVLVRVKVTLEDESYSTGARHCGVCRTPKGARLPSQILIRHSPVVSEIWKMYRSILLKI
jgi:hypothetical protein